MTTDPWKAGVRDPARIAAVKSSGLAGTGPEDAFDRLIELAVAVTGVPRGCITLVDGERTTAKSAIGFPEGSPLSAPVDQSFCRFVVASGRSLVLDDARCDPGTTDDAAIKAFGAVAWAGYPIEDADGVVLGTFCLMDSEPHQWTAIDLHTLATLAKAASSEIALRCAQKQVRAYHKEADDLRSAAKQDRATIEAHLNEVVALGGPGADVGRELMAWLDAHLALPAPQNGLLLKGPRPRG